MIDGRGGKHAVEVVLATYQSAKREDEGRVTDGGIEGLGWKGSTGRAEGWKSVSTVQSSNPSNLLTLKTDCSSLFSISSCFPALGSFSSMPKTTNNAPKTLSVWSTT